MNVCLLTCDKYDWLVPGFMHMFRKYWPDDTEVTIVGFRPPPPITASGWRYQPVGEHEHRPWTDHMRAVFEHYPDEHFLLLLDDYWLVQPVDPKHLATLEQAIELGADKADLSDNTRCFGAQPWSRMKGMIVADQRAKYRTSLQPAIWTREYLLHLLKPGRTIWDFERLGRYDANNDGGQIVAHDWPPRQCVFRYANVYKKGQPDKRQLPKIQDTDRAALVRMGYDVMLRKET
jgi:hypothetical protein